MSANDPSASDVRETWHALYPSNPMTHQTREAYHIARDILGES